MVRKTATTYLSFLLIMVIGLAVINVDRTNPVEVNETVVQVMDEPKVHDFIKWTEMQMPETIEQAPERKVIIARVTAYAPFDNVSGICADENPSVTSVGHRPSPQYVAVDPARIPYGTKLMIPDYGEVIAGDTGGALRAYDGIAIDVFMDTYAEAIAWGVQYLEVEILESGGD